MRLSIKRLKSLPLSAPCLRRTPGMPCAWQKGYAMTIHKEGEHREFFQGVAQMKKKERLAVIQGYRNAGQSRGIVHAVSQLPRLQGRTLMKDFVIKENKEKDQKAIKEVLYWLRDAGEMIQAMRKGKCRNTRGRRNGRSRSRILRRRGRCHRRCSYLCGRCHR